VKITISNDPKELGMAAGKEASTLIQKAISENGQANIILATGTSQFETLSYLIQQDIDWSKVVMFHLDEYIGLPESSPASFRKYLRERFLAKVPPLKEVYLVNADGHAAAATDTPAAATDPRDTAAATNATNASNASDPRDTAGLAAAAECARLGELIKQRPIDVALVGIGENGHLGFNDPPADFETENAFIVVKLDEACRKQQFGEGWFATLEDVPTEAITMSIRQILRSKHIICSVPDSRKAVAVKNSLEAPISNLNPASILQTHPNCDCFLDKASAALLSPIGV
jgi:glucosamine-6-phosphate deaminase